jgi:hypothetical protein
MFYFIARFVINMVSAGDEEKDKNKPGHYTASMCSLAVAPCPRGHGWETFRFTEALECGAIPIIDDGGKIFSNYMPGLNNVVLTTTTEWKTTTDGRPLVDVVAELLNNPIKLEQKQKALIKWYNDYKEYMRGIVRDLIAMVPAHRSHQALPLHDKERFPARTLKNHIKSHQIAKKNHIKSHQIAKKNHIKSHQIAKENHIKSHQIAKESVVVNNVPLAAMVIATRAHPKIAATLANALLVLPGEIPVYFVHGLRDGAYAQAVVRNLTHGADRVILKESPHTTFTRETYQKFLVSAWLWDAIPADKVITRIHD